MVSISFYFHPEPWGRFPFWRAYFSKGLVQPPTRLPILEVSNTANVWQLNTGFPRVGWRNILPSLPVIPHQVFGSLGICLYIWLRRISVHIEKLFFFNSLSEKIEFICMLSTYCRKVRLIFAHVSVSTGMTTHDELNMLMPYLSNRIPHAVSAPKGRPTTISTHRSWGFWLGVCGRTKN